MLDIIDEMESGKPNGLGRIFSESEWLGYWRTGGLAALEYLPDSGKPNRYTKEQRVVFGRIATDVLTINEKRVAKVAEKNEYARQLVLGRISTMRSSVKQFAKEFPVDYANALESAKQRS